MCAKFHCPTSADTLFSKDVEGGGGGGGESTPPQSQKAKIVHLTLVKLYFKIIFVLDAEVRCPEGSLFA